MFADRLGTPSASRIDGTAPSPCTLPEGLLSALAHCSDGIAVVDATGVIAWVNPAFARLVGRGANFVVGLPCGQLLTSPDKRFESGWGMADRRDTWQGELQLKLPGTRHCTVQAAISTLDPAGTTMLVLRAITARTAESELQQMVDQYPLPCWIFDVETLAFVAVNEMAVRQYGYSREAFLKMSIADIRPREDLPRLHREVAQTSATMKDAGRWRHRLASGALIDVHILSRRFLHEGRALAFVVARNVSDERLVARRLALFEGVVVHANDAVMIAEAQPLEEPGPRIIYVNPGFTRQTGYLPEEVLGRSPRLLLGPLSDRATLAVVRTALEQARPVEVELINYRKDGTPYWVDLSITPLVEEPGELPTHFIAVQRDIGERKRIEQTLREREEFYRGIVTTVAEGIWLLGDDHRTLYVNDRTCHLLGCAEGDSAIRSFLQFVDPLEQPRVEACLRQLAAGEVVRFETLLRRTDTSELWVFVSARRLQGNSSQPGGTLLLLADATERRQLQEQNLALELAQLEMAQLQKLNQLKDDFLSTVSHELRTPLASMKLAINLLEPLCHSTSSGRRYWEILSQEWNRELQLVNDLLDLQRLESGHTAPEPREFELGAWLARTTDAFATRAERDGQHLSLHNTDTPLHIRQDPLILERVLTELLHNACKYTPAGENIAVALTFDATDVWIEVSNSGVEIPAEHLPHIFEKFYRVAALDLRQQGGTGLGLALVRRLLASLGGSITVTSAERQTVFTLRLPQLFCAPAHP